VAAPEQRHHEAGGASNDHRQADQEDKSPGGQGTLDESAAQADFDGRQTDRQQKDSEQHRAHHIASWMCASGTVIIA
jgi:hypothetical protein